MQARGRFAGSFLAFGIMFCLLALGCASEEKEWGKAKSANTIAAYVDFLKRYSQGTLADSARARVEMLYFSEAQKAHTIAAYENFLN